MEFYVQYPSVFKIVRFFVVTSFDIIYNYIFILHLTPSFNGMDKDNNKTRR